MNTKRTALAVAAAGTVAGVVGLVLIAVPTGAGAAPPELPAVSPEALVQSVMTTKVPAMSGTAQLIDNLGLPLPGLSGGKDGTAAKVFTDGQGRARVVLPDEGSERAIVEDGTTTWIWNSADKSVTKVPHGENKRDPQGELSDPQAAATGLVKIMREESTVSVQGTGWVADRAVYQLVLTPKPTERTLLREIRVAVDSELRVPLQLEVFANGQADPALKLGFTEFTAGAQDPGLFTFTPPQGAKVTEQKPGDTPSISNQEQLFTALTPQVVGSGWDTALVVKVPADLFKSAPGDKGDKGSFDPMAMLRQFGKPVSGSFGNGWAIEAKVGTIVVTEDGRAAVGAVPSQVLVDALGQAK